jgi:hypothetical protein
METEDVRCLRVDVIGPRTEVEKGQGREGTERIKGQGRIT